MTQATQKPPPGTDSPNASTRPKKHSTAHYRVGIERAGILACHHPAFSVVEIRECLEGEPLKKAVNLLNWAIRKSPMNPYKPLKNWARRNSTGFYSPEVRRIDTSEHYRRCMLHIRRKDAEKLDSAGRNLFPREREDLVQEYYAPRYRAELTEGVKDPNHLDEKEAG